MRSCSISSARMTVAGCVSTPPVGQYRLEIQAKTSGEVTVGRADLRRQIGHVSLQRGPVSDEPHMPKRVREAPLAMWSPRHVVHLHRVGPAFRAGRSETDPLNFIEVLREPAAIAKRFGELQAGAQRELLIFTKPPYAVEPGENLEGLELLGRGVQARSLYERTVYDNPAVAEVVRSFVAAGEQARVVDQLPLKLVIIDERVTLFTMEDPVAGSTDLTITIVEHPSLARLHKLAFERAWQQGEDFH